MNIQTSDVQIYHLISDPRNSTQYDLSISRDSTGVLQQHIGMLGLRTSMLHVFSSLEKCCTREDYKTQHIVVPLNNTMHRDKVSMYYLTSCLCIVNVWKNGGVGGNADSDHNKP